ncbi:MAG: carbonic anhydrase family protein [Reinekea sp.]|nr:carbonic anhydrase family protein [Reinekea sp.]
MKKSLMPIALACASITLLPSFSSAENSLHWSYAGHEGPEYWGSLSPEFQTCQTGKNQSPIDIESAIESDLPELMFLYTNAATDALNNGHTVQVNFPAGNTLVIDELTYELKQFHFHTPSENKLDGQSFPLEAHFVHADADGNLAVVAQFFQEGKANAALTDLLKNVPDETNPTTTLSRALEAKTLLNTGNDYYRFTGSLTTPPCTEGVQWLVMKEPMTASAEQISQLGEAMHQPNNRPTQPLNDRVVLK